MLTQPPPPTAKKRSPIVPILACTGGFLALAALGAIVGETDTTTETNGAGDTTAAPPPPPAPSTTATTLPPTPEQALQAVAAAHLDNPATTWDGTTAVITYDPGTQWDEVQTFHLSYRDAADVIPAVYNDPALAPVNDVCLELLQTFTSPTGQESSEPATRLCMTRPFAQTVVWENTDQDRLFFLARGGTPGFTYYVHPAVLANIDFE